MFGPRIPATTLERLWTMLAHAQGGLLNASQIARALEVSTQSVTRYIDLLSDLLLVRRLLPLHANVGKRLVKSPKVYIRDSGLVHALLGLETLIQLSGHPVVGQSWEGFVIETVLAAAPWRSQASFYRTSAGAEIDLVLEHKNGHLWAIEIKRGLSAKPGAASTRQSRISSRSGRLWCMPVMTDIRLPSGSRPLASAIWWQNCAAAPPYK